MYSGYIAQVRNIVVVCKNLEDIYVVSFYDVTLLLTTSVFPIVLAAFP